MDFSRLETVVCKTGWVGVGGGVIEDPQDSKIALQKCLEAIQNHLSSQQQNQELYLMRFAQLIPTRKIKK